MDILIQISFKFFSLNFIITSSNGNFIPVTGPLWGESTGDRWVPLTKSMTWSFSVFIVLHLNKCLRKQTRRRWFETQSCSLWRHCNVGNESALSNTVEFHIIAPQHDDVIKWKHFPRYWPFVRGIHRSPVNSPHKGQRRGALMFSLICVWINGWVNDREAGDLRRYHAHYDYTVMD